MASEATARTAESKIASVRNSLRTWYLTMRLSDAGLRRRPTKLIYPNHPPPPLLSEAAARDRSSRFLAVCRRIFLRNNCGDAVSPGVYRQGFCRFRQLPEIEIGGSEYLAASFKN